MEPSARADADEQVVTIAVKSPYPEAPAFHTQVPANATIAQLKRVLAAEYPGNPSADLQRLIFAGHLCNDQATVGSVVAKHRSAGTDGSFSFHMIVRGTSSFSGQSSPALSPAPPAGATPLHRASSAAAPSPLVPQRSTPLQRAYSASLRSSAAPGLGMTSAPPTTPAASSARSAASVTPSPALAAALARAATAAMPTSAPAPSVADAAAALAGWPGGMPPSPLLLASAVGMAPTAPLPSVGLAPNGQPAPFWASPPPFAMPPPFTASPPPGVDPALFALHLQQWYVQYYTAMMQLGPMGGMSVGAAAQSAASMLTSAPPGTSGAATTPAVFTSPIAGGMFAPPFAGALLGAVPLGPPPLPAASAAAAASEQHGPRVQLPQPPRPEQPPHAAAVPPPDAGAQEAREDWQFAELPDGVRAPIPPRRVRLAGGEGEEEEEGQAARRPRLLVLDVRLIIKMVIMLTIFGQGVSQSQLLVFICVSVVLYMQQTGMLAGIVARLRARRHGALQPPAPPHALPPQAPQARAAPGAEPDVDARAADVDAQGAFERERVPVVQPGLWDGLIMPRPEHPSLMDRVRDVGYAGSALALSLMPSWHPTPAAAMGIRVRQDDGMPEPAAAAAGGEGAPAERQVEEQVLPEQPAVDAAGGDEGLRRRHAREAAAAAALERQRRFAGGEEAGGQR